MKTVLYNFGSHLGDLLISRGMANALWREKQEKSVACTYLTDEDIYKYLQNENFTIRYSKHKEDYNMPVIHPDMQLFKNYLGDNRFQYVYKPSASFLKHLHKVYEKQIRDGVFEGVTKVYSLHMQFNIIYLGYYLNKHYGIEADGYMFLEKDGIFYLNVNNLWAKDGIIQQHAGLLGVQPRFEDFQVFGKQERVEWNSVLLLPATRYNVNLTNQYWDLAKLFFRKQGFIVHKAVFREDYDTIDELANLIRVNRIIVTNDSFPYHLAWTMEKDIILKQKMGVVSEWTHRDGLYQKEGKTFIIPPIELYEEEYVQRLADALQYFNKEG